MKNLILLLSVVVLTFTSCNSDDDSALQEDSFVGIWTNSKILFNSNEQPIDDCDRQSTFSIKSDGTFTESAYHSDTGGSCVFEFEEPGTWENLGNGIYRLIYDPIGNEPSYEEDITVNNNTFSVFYDDPYIYVFTKN